MRYTGSKCKRCLPLGSGISRDVLNALLFATLPLPVNTALLVRKRAEYAEHLLEKQRIRLTHDVSEKQFYSVFVEASKSKGVTGIVMLQLLESRLDNILFRANLAGSRAHARQIISHGHVLMNGKKVSIPSARTKQGDVIAIAEKSAAFVKAAHKASFVIPDWLAVDEKNLTASVSMVPQREQLDQTFKDSCNRVLLEITWLESLSDRSRSKSLNRRFAFANLRFHYYSAVI